MLPELPIEKLSMPRLRKASVATILPLPPMESDRTTGRVMQMMTCLYLA